MKNRVLTVESLVKTSISHLIGRNSKPKMFSKIRLQGKWLTELGFKPGDKIKIIPEHNRLVIERRES